MKKKIILIISIIMLFILIIFAASYIKNKNIIKKINESYNEYVITNKESALYILENNYNIIGTIKENVYLELEQPNIKTKNDKYFKIKNTDYYINYKDIEKAEKQVVERLLESQPLMKKLSFLQ